MAARKTYHHGDLRSTLVAEGLRALEKAGAERISLREIAKTIGVSPNAPYRHFTDKNALMGALAAGGFQRFAQSMVTKASHPDPLQALHDQGLAYLIFARESPALYRLMFSPYGYSLHSETCQIESQRAFGSLIETAKRAQTAGWAPQSSLLAASLEYWSALHGWACLNADRLIPEGLPSISDEEWLAVRFFHKKTLDSRLTAPGE